MGLEKVGTTIGKEIIAWTRTSGSKNLLATKPVKVNPKSLGYIHKNGEITFRSNEAALNYSKNACLASSKLPQTQQFEIGVVRDGNIILGEINGTHRHVNMSSLDIFSHENIQLRKIKPRKLSVEHYHPDLYGKGKTTPISIGCIGADTELLESGYLKSITAYNSLGQYNKVEILPNYQSGNIYDFVSEFLKFIKNIAIPKNKQERFALLDTIRQLSEKTNFIRSIQNKKEYSALRRERDKILREFQETPEFARATHNFWVENAEKYGMKYSTNMTF